MNLLLQHIPLKFLVLLLHLHLDHLVPKRGRTKKYPKTATPTGYTVPIATPTDYPKDAEFASFFGIQDEAEYPLPTELYTQVYALLKLPQSSQLSNAQERKDAILAASYSLLSTWPKAVVEVPGDYCLGCPPWNTFREQSLLTIKWTKESVKGLRIPSTFTDEFEVAQYGLGEMKKCRGSSSSEVLE